MSISSSGTRKAGPFSGNGSTTAFPFSFKVFQASDVLVVQTDTTPTDYTLTLNTDYTVALNANQDANPGGTVNMTMAPASGYMLTIGSQVPQIQSVTLTNNGGFYPTVINTALDYVTILIQQLSEKIGRALVMPFSTNASGQLPPVAPGSLLGWKADGTGIANVGASGVGAGGIVAANMAAGATGTALSTDTQAAPIKATPADADKVPLFDSANFWYLKSLTWANLKVAVRTYIASLLNMAGAVNEAQTTVASVVTPDIWTGSGNIISYTGTATATGFAAAPQAGARRLLDCTGAAAFTAGANMLIDGFASGNTLTVGAGDRVEVYARTATQFVLRHLRQDALIDSTITPASDPSYANNSNSSASTSWIRGAMSAIATGAGFAYSFAANGYIKLPSWLGSWIVQWGIGNTTGGAAPYTAAVTFPITFPSAVRAVLPASDAGATSGPPAMGSGSTTTSGTTITSGGPTPFFYIVTGY